MRPLTTPDLMATWEAAAQLAPAARPLALLAAGCPDRSAEELARLPVGQRDGMLLSQREWAFGGQVVSLADCPQCSQPVELRFQIAAIRVDDAAAPETIAFQANGYKLRVRAPNGADLEAAAQAEDEATAVALLLRRCVLSARRGGNELPAEELPEQVLRAIEDRMARADPQADIELALSCPACSHGWLAGFDIGAFFWTEIEAWARRVLHDVHRLALAYGWREPDVLALSPRRRQHYLDMVGA
jgi:hypothetical protein